MKCTYSFCDVTLAGIVQNCSDCTMFVLFGHYQFPQLTWPRRAGSAAGLL